MKVEPRDGSESKLALLWALFGLFKGSLLFNAIPRLMLITFRFSQPVLIINTVEYVMKPVTEAEKHDNTGYHLIFATFIIYVGYGVSNFIS